MTCDSGNLGGGRSTAGCQQSSTDLSEFPLMESFGKGIGRRLC